MRKLFTLCLLVFALSASAQWQQTGSKVRYVNGLGIPTRDTAAGVAADSSQILIRPADSSLYVKYKRTWLRVGGGTVSGTPNRVSKFTGSTTVGNSSIVDSASAVAININPSGNVGINITNPSDRLQVGGGILVNDRISAGGTNPSLLTGDPGSYPRWQFIVGAKIWEHGYRSGTTNYEIREDSNTRMVIANGGNVGINQTAPAGRFVVADGQTLLGTNTNNGVDRLQVSGNTLSTRYKVNTSGQELQINNYYVSGTGQNIWIGTGGASITSAAYWNISMGFDALKNITSGTHNLALGAYSLEKNTSGVYNFALGVGSLNENTTGNNNVAIGVFTLQKNSTGSNNTGIGNAALYVATASKNTAIGDGSLSNITTGASNIGIGHTSGVLISGGLANQTSTQSIYIGEDTRASANGNTNEIVIGHTNIGQGSNTVTLGNSSITRTFLRGSVMVNTTTDNGVDKLQVSGSIQGTGFDQSYLARTTAYTATDTDYLIDCTSGTFTVTLPASSGRTGRILIIKNSGTGTITVDGNAAETIDGAATYSLSAQWATVQIMSDGTNWKILAKF